MIDYRAGQWGFHVAVGWKGSLAPRALVMAIPNAILTFCIAMLLDLDSENLFYTAQSATAATVVIATFTPSMLFILQNRSRTSYNRWWEGGTLLQKTRGEWFNAYSSILAFTSTKPELQDQVDSYIHLVARLMSLLMCCGLQQVSPNRDRPFEIIDLDGIEPSSMEFLNSAPDKVEIILQWIQRSMVLHAQTGVLPVAPPILSRAFQEVSRGIVNLQNARKIADYPYPYPLAQVSMILQLLHWASTPVSAALALPKPWAVAFSFFSIFTLWCIHFNALDLEFPFGSRVNDLPMQEFQQDWNRSICTLISKRATRPPRFEYDPLFHDTLSMAMSDASDLYAPKHTTPMSKQRRKLAVIKVPDSKRSTLYERDSQMQSNSKMSVLSHTASMPTRQASGATQLVGRLPAQFKREGPPAKASGTDARAAVSDGNTDLTGSISARSSGSVAHGASGQLVSVASSGNAVATASSRNDVTPRTTTASSRPSSDLASRGGSQTALPIAGSIQPLVLEPVDRGISASDSVETAWPGRPRSID